MPGRPAPDRGSARTGPPPIPAGGERRLVSIVFADLAGYTALSERLDPEDLVRVVAPGMAELQERIREFGGSVVQILGDGILAAFGAPAAHGDDPERAVRAALAVRDHAHTLRARSPSFPEVHAGIATGEVMVTPSADPVGFRVLGDTVNTAARISTIATARHVLVDELTHAATSSAIRYGAPRRARAKGKEEPLRIFEALGVREGRPVSLRRQGRFVGRERALTRVLEELDRASREQRARVLVVTGEAGSGKTRLAAELTEVAPDVAIRYGACRAYGQRPLQPLADALGTGGEDRLDLAAARRTARIAAEGAAAVSRLVLVVDDAHWADPDLLATIDRVRDRPWAGPILVLVLARPEGAPPGRPRIELDPLDRSSMQVLARSLLEGEIAPEVLRELVPRANGNPLFLDELLRTLVERGALTRSGSGWTPAPGERLAELPARIRGLVAERLDALPSEERDVLLNLAVCGEVAWERLLAELCDADVGRALRALGARGLVARRRTSIRGEREFALTHQLMRDVALASLPRRDRAARHHVAGRWIAERAGGRADHDALVAYHLREAWSLERRHGVDPAVARDAADALARWAERLRASQARGAEEVYGDALLAAADAGDGGDGRGDVARLRAGLLVGRAECLLEMGRHREVVRDARQARTIAAGLGDAALEARALLALGRASSDDGRVVAARRHLLAARDRFADAGDEAGLGWVAHRLSETWALSDYSKELALLEEAFERATEAGDELGRRVASGDLAYLLSLSGGEPFRRWFGRAEALARDGDLRSRVGLLRTRGVHEWSRGDRLAALATMREVRPIAVDAGDRYAEGDALQVGGLAAAATGHLSEAAELAAATRRLAEDTGSLRLLAGALTAAAQVALRTDAGRGAARRLAQVRRSVDDEGSEVLGDELALAEAELALLRGAWQRVGAFATRAAGAIDRHGWRLYAPLPSLQRGRAALGAGRLDEALDALEGAARTAAADGGGTHELATACLDLARSTTGTGGPHAPTGWTPGDPEAAAVAADTAAAVARTSGAADAVDLAAAAVAAWQRLGSTVWLARAHAAHAIAVRERGDARGAAAERRRARTILTRLGTPAATIDRLLRS